MRGALLGRGVEELLDESQLAVAADERRLEPGGLERPAPTGCDAERAEELRCLLLALQLVHAGVLVDDRRLARAAGGVADEHRARAGCGLDARRGVDEVAGDHALAFRADRHGGLAGQHSGASGKLGCADLVSERRHRGDQVERCANRALGVIFRRGRRSPDGHHRVADELLDRPAVQLDEATTRVEVAGEELAHLLRIAALRQRCEANEVGEEDGDETALGCRCDGWRNTGRRGSERCAALAAELLARLVGGSARWAAAREGRSALGAELPPLTIVGAAVRAGHAWTSTRAGAMRSSALEPRRRPQLLEDLAALGERHGRRSSAHRAPGA